MRFSVAQFKPALLINFAVKIIIGKKIAQYESQRLPTIVCPLPERIWFSFRI